MKHPKSPKLTKNQQLFQQELKKLHRRAAEWERKRGIVFTDFPVMPKRVTAKDIQRVKQIQLKNFTPQQIKQYQTAQPTDTYSPPTEDEYTSGTPAPIQTAPDWQEEWGTQDKTPSDDYAEMEAWIEEKIDTILNPTLIEREREGAKELLQTIIDNARQQLGTKGFYEFLQDTENAAQLEAAAHAYMKSYKRKNGTDTGEPQLERFVQTINLGRPLTDEQAYELQAYGTVNLDYSGTDYE